MKNKDIKNRQEYSRIYRLKNKERIKEYTKEYNRRTTQKRKLYRELNSEKIKQCKLQYALNHPEKIKERQRKADAKRRLENIMYSSAKNRAKKNNLDFSITLDDIVIPEICPILGTPLFKGTKNSKKNSPSLDRIDNSKGYIKGNIAVISQSANRCKSDLTLEQIERLYFYSAKRLNELNEESIKRYEGVSE